MNTGAHSRTMKIISIISLFIGFSVQGLSAKDRNDHQIKLQSFSLSDVSHGIEKTVNTGGTHGFKKASKQKSDAFALMNNQVVNLIQMNNNSVFVKVRF